MAPLRCEKKILPTQTLTSGETPSLRPRKAIVVYNERQLQARANDERQLRMNQLSSKSLSNGISILTDTGASTASSIIEEDNKKINRKRRSSTDLIEITQTKVNNKRRIPTARKPEPPDVEVFSQIMTRSSTRANTVGSELKAALKAQSKGERNGDEDFKAKLIRLSAEINNEIAKSAIKSAVKTAKEKNNSFPVYDSDKEEDKVDEEEKPVNALERFDQTMETVLKSLSRTSAEFAMASTNLPLSISKPSTSANITLPMTSKPYVYTPRLSSSAGQKPLATILAKSGITALPLSSNSASTITTSTQFRSSNSAATSMRLNTLLSSVTNFGSSNLSDLSYGNLLLEASIPSNNSYEDVYRIPQARSRWSVMARTTVDVTMLGRALFHDDPAWSRCVFPKRSLFGRECVVYFYKSKRWAGKKLVFVPYGKGAVPSDIPYTCGLCFKISACLKHRFDLKQRNKIPIIIARHRKLIDDPDYPLIPHICDPNHLSDAEKVALVEYGELMAKGRIDENQTNMMVPDEAECNNLLILAEARLTECCIKLLSVGFDFTHETMREKALEIARETNLPVYCVTDAWLAGVATRLGVIETPPEVLAATVASNCNEIYCDTNGSETSSIAIGDYLTHGDENNVVDYTSIEMLSNGGFTNINDYLKNMVKEAMLSHQVEEDKNKITNNNNTNTNNNTKESISIIVKESCPIEFIVPDGEINEISQTTTSAPLSTTSSSNHTVTPFAVTNLIAPMVASEMTTAEFLAATGLAQNSSTLLDKVSLINIKKEAIEDGNEIRLDKDEDTYSQIDELIATQMQKIIIAPSSDDTLPMTTALEMITTTEATTTPEITTKSTRKNCPSTLQSRTTRSDVTKVISTPLTTTTKVESTTDLALMAENPLECLATTSMETTVANTLAKLRSSGRRATVNSCKQRLKPNEKVNDAVENSAPSTSTISQSTTRSTSAIKTAAKGTLHAVIQQSFTETIYPEVADALETIKKHIIQRDCSLLPMFNTFSARIAKMMYATKPKMESSLPMKKK